MKRADLINELHKRTGETKGSLAKIIDAYEQAIIDSLQAGEDVQLHGFVKFIVHDVEERDFIIPSTDKSVTIPSHKKIMIRPGTLLKAITE